MKGKKLGNVLHPSIETHCGTPDIVAFKDGTHPAKNPFHFKIIQIYGDFSKPKHADNDA